MVVFIISMIAAVIFGGSYYAYRISFYSPKKDRGRIPDTSGKLYDPYRPRMKEVWEQLNSRSFETVSIVSQDGLTLTGRYYHVKDDAPLDIGFHGYRSHPLTDFSGGSELIFQMEHNLLLVDQRAHGSSEGNTITFGIMERQDVISWVNYALKRFGNNTQIILYGVSMGGATVLMASDLPLPPAVKCIVADCPYNSPVDIILEVGKKLHYPPKLIRPFLILGAKLYGGFNLLETDAVKAVKNSKIPILIIHGEADGFVPCDMSKLVADANPEIVRRETFPGADHGISYLVDTPRYANLIRKFVGRALA